MCEWVHRRNPLHFSHYEIVLPEPRGMDKALSGLDTPRQPRIDGLLCGSLRGVRDHCKAKQSKAKEKRNGREEHSNRTG